MRLLSMLGEKAAAVDRFNRFARLARSELGVDPERETVALLEQIRRASLAQGVGQAAPAGNPVLIRPDQAPLVGRAEERQEILSLLEAAQTGTGSGILFLGEAGIGKSKLAEWVMEEWAARGGATVRGRCVEFNEPVPYQPLLDALESYVDSGDLAGFVGEAGSGLTPLEQTTVDSVSGAHDDVTPWPSGKLRLFNWLRSRLDNESRRRPFLIVIEDLQWADTGTLDFLAYLLERTRTMHLGVLLTARPTEDRSRHASRVERLFRYCTAILRLKPLTEVETVDLVRSLLEGKAVSPRMTSWVFDETEGNPLFVIETLRLLQQQGRVSSFDENVAQDSWKAVASPSSTGIPGGVRSAVQQRLALIDPASLKIAEIASVLGRSFDEDLLAMIAKCGENRLSRAIGSLLRAGIFEREKVGYRFSHDKIRAVCYENLPSATRRTYHARAAAAMVQMPDILMHKVAWHQLCAGQWHLAASSWNQAGDRARGIHAYEEAFRAYAHAISCVRRDETKGAGARNLDEFGLLVKSEEVLAILGRPAERREILAHMGALCRATPQPTLEATWLIRNAALEEHIGNFSLAYRLARRAWMIARSAGDLSTGTESLRIMQMALYRAGRHRRSLAVAKLALRELGESRSPLKAAVLRVAAGVYVSLGDYSSASIYIHLAKSALVELGFVEEHPLILVGEALIQKWAGNLQASRASFAKALRFAQESRDLFMVARITFQLATLDALEGRLGDSILRLRRSSIQSRSIGSMRTYLSCLNEVAHSVGRAIGNYRWAWNAATRALELFRPGDIRALFAILKDSQAQLLLEEGRPDKAFVIIDEVLRFLDVKQDSVHSYTESLAKRGIISLHMNKVADAVSNLESAKQTQARTNERLLLVDTLTYLALAYARQGDADRALATSEEALNLLAAINHANLQPQRIFWHHYLIFEMFDRSPRLPFLERAVEFIEAQASSVSRAQARRLRQEVPLNREILATWERARQPLRPIADAVSS